MNIQNGFDKDDAYKNLDRVNFWIANLDTKASFALAFIGIFLTVVFTSDFTYDNIKNLAEIIKKITVSDLKVVLVFATLISLGIFIVFLLLGAQRILNVLMPTIDTTQESGVVNNSNLFYGNISTKSFIQFEQDVKSSSQESIINDIHSQTYINSKICANKTANLRKGIKYVCNSLMSFLVLILFLYLIQMISTK